MLMRFTLLYLIWVVFILSLGVTTHGHAQENVEISESVNGGQVTVDEIVETDTLTEAYSDKWQGVPTGEDVSMVERVLGSNNLIFVVLTVSLIIWFVLLTFLIRLDKKVTRIENSTHQLNS